MEYIEIGFMIFMLPVIFFAIVVPSFKFGLWLSIDYWGDGAYSTWYGFMAYMIIAFWGVGLGVSACVGWAYLWVGK